MLASAWLVGQRGRITRIVSGCHDKRAEHVAHRHQTFPAGKNDLLVPMEHLDRSVHDDFGLYVTPPFEGAVDFPWINKPSSIDYFAKHALPELQRMGETVVAILDPDFIFLKPLTMRGEDSDDIIQTRRSAEPIAKPIDVVEKGRPVAQRYGIEGGWVGKFDVAKFIGDPRSPALSYSHSKAGKYFSVGPPMMFHVDDLVKFAPLWSKLMRPVVKQDPDILADMWAYSMGSAHLGLRHTILDHYMISTWGSHGQAFKWILNWPDKEFSCRDPWSSDARVAPTKVHWPTFIHLASNFKAPKKGWPAEWMFHKGHIPANILDCDTPFIVEAPDDTWKISPVSHHNWSQMSAWVMCNTVARLNQVLLKYKQKFCPGQKFERRKLIRLIQSKSKDRGCSERRHKWCWPLAQIEGLPDDWRKQGLGPILTGPSA